MVTPTLGGTRIKLAPHPLDPAEPGCLLPLLAEGLVLASLAGLHGLGVPGAWQAAAVLGTISAAIAWPVTGTLLVHLLGRLVGRPRLRLTLTTAMLARTQPIRSELPLDEIEAVEAARERRRPLRPWAVVAVRQGGVRERVAWGLRADEARWLAGALREAATRRRAALAAEGHTLAEAAGVPAALRAAQAKAGPPSPDQ